MNKPYLDSGVVVSMEQGFLVDGLKDFADPRVDIDVVDGRLPLSALYRAYAGFATDSAWLMELVHELDVPDEAGNSLCDKLPVVLISSITRGEALWLIAGVHGEEPAGPNALAQNMHLFEELRKLGIPVVILPMCNPSGYFRDWRYFNAPNWEKNGKGASVTDSSHLLPRLDHPYALQANQPSCEAADDITMAVLRLSHFYPPRLVVDLHEDRCVDGVDIYLLPYIYSQGYLGAEDPVARRVVEILRASGMGMQMDGLTRFGEPINRGVVVDRGDGSIDDLLSRREIVARDKRIIKPPAKSVVVVETSVLEHSLGQRVEAHAAVLRALPELWAMASKK